MERLLYLVERKMYKMLQHYYKLLLKVISLLILISDFISDIYWNFQTSLLILTLI